MKSGARPHPTPRYEKSPGLDICTSPGSEMTHQCTATLTLASWQKVKIRWREGLCHLQGIPGGLPIPVGPDYELKGTIITLCSPLAEQT